MSLDTSDRRSGAFRSVTRLVLALMAVLFVAGCGSSRGEFVVPGPGPGPGPGLNTGTLIYNFNVNPQAPLDVPAGITRVEFDLHNGPNGTGAIIDSRNATFATTITLTNVSTAVESSVLTFYNEFNFPVWTATVDVDVVANGSTVVDFANVNGTSIAVDALTVTPTEVTLAPGEDTVTPIGVTLSFANGDVATVNSGDYLDAGITFESTDEAVATVTDDGFISAVATGTATINVGLTFDPATATVDVTVDPAAGVLAYITVTPETLTLLALTPSYQLTVRGFDGFDNEVEIDLADFSFESSDETVLTVDANGVVTPGAPGGATVTVTNDDDATITASSDITVTNETVDSIAFFDGEGDSISELDLYVSELADLHVTATLSDTSEIVDFQDQGFLDVTAGDEYLGFVNGEFIALHEVPTPGTPVAATISVDTTVTTDNLSVTEDIDVDVRRVQLTDVAVRIGGIAEGEPGFGSIPEGYTGVIEVIGTFEDGSVRELAGGGADQPGFDYEIDFGGDTDFIRPPFTPFRTNETLRAVGGDDDEATLTITFTADRAGDLNDDPLEIPLTVADPSNPTAAGTSFAYYSDDTRLIEGTPGPYRELDVRVDFTGVNNFRIAWDDVNQISEPLIPSTNTFGSWPAIAANGIGLDLDVSVEVSAGGVNPTEVTVELEGVTSAAPDFLGLEPADDETVPIGSTLSYSTLVDYGDGEGLVNRSADYLPFDTRFDFIHWVYVTLSDYATGFTASNFFVKSTDGGVDFDVAIYDRAELAVDALGTGDDLVEITVTP